MPDEVTGKFTEKITLKIQFKFTLINSLFQIHFKKLTIWNLFLEILFLKFILWNSLCEIHFLELIFKLSLFEIHFSKFIFGNWYHHTIKYHLSNTFYQIPFIKYCLSDTSFCIQNFFLLRMSRSRYTLLIH